MSYDAACYDLAEHFLADEGHLAGDTDALAQRIQDTVELFLEFELPKRFPQPVRDD